MAVFDELLLMPSLRAHRSARGRLVLTRKFLNGTAEYAKHWPGPARTFVFETTTPTGDMDHVEVDDSGAYPPVALRPESVEQLRPVLERAAAVLAFLGPYELPLARLCHALGVPLIFTSEYSVRTEKQIIDATTRNPLLRWRRKRWIDHAERVRREMLAMASGLQCSGTPTFDQYRSACRSTLLFFDNRVPCDTVLTRDEIAVKFRDLGSRPLRLVFGGRLVPMKGVQWLCPLAAELQRRRIRFTLEIVGQGELEVSLRHAIEADGLGDAVKLRGALDFSTGWVPLLKNEADLFVCPHPQGDPSSTYPEVLSCGVPIVGFDNEAFRGIVAHSGSGWLVPTGDVTAMADVIERIDRDRSLLLPAALAGHDFAAEHCFERTFAARMRHIVALSRLPDSMKLSLATDVRRGSNSPADARP